MSEIIDDKSSSRPNHRQKTSQTEFTKRLRHLQRSEPVNSKDLMQRLEGLLAGSENGTGKRNIYVEAKTMEESKLRAWSLSSTSTPKQNVRDSALNPLLVARSTMVGDTQDDEDMGLMSRVANALQACRDADPQHAPVCPPTRSSAYPFFEEREGTYWRDMGQHRRDSDMIRRKSGISIHDEFAEVTKGVARKSVVFSAPKVIEIPQSREPLPRLSCAIANKTSPNISSTMKKRGVEGRKVPAPLILTMMPKASKPNLVDVSSPLTTKPQNTLSDFEPLSPFGASFSQDAGSFLVYQPKASRQSAMSSSSIGTGRTVPASPIASFPPSRFPDAIAGIPTLQTRNTWHTVAFASRTSSMSLGRNAVEAFPGLNSNEQRQTEAANIRTRKVRDSRFDSASSRNKSDINKMQSDSPIVSKEGGVKSVQADTPVDNVPGRARRRSDCSVRVPPLVFLEESTDDRSDRAVSSVFEESTTAARSSRTSVAGERNQRPDLERCRQESMRAGSPAGLDPFADFGYGTAASEGVMPPPISRETSWPQPSGQETAKPFVSPLSSPTLDSSPKQTYSPSASSVVEAFAIDPSRKYIPRKPVTSTQSQHQPQESLPKSSPILPEPARHDSHGFSAAREYIRDSVDGEHAQFRMETIRQVHSAANRGSDASNEEWPSPPKHLPLRTPITPETGQWEVIANGIAMIDLDGPTIRRSVLNLSIQTQNDLSRTATDESRASISPLQESQVSKRSSPPMPYHKPPPRPISSAQKGFTPDVKMNEPRTASLQQALARDRRRTDATITSISSKPDYRARPLVQEMSSTSPSMSASVVRPKTAGARPRNPSPLVPSLLGKMKGTKIKFPPRANTSEVSHMSPESLKLLHEQENLLRLRYEAVLSPIDVALKARRPSDNQSPTLKQDSGYITKKPDNCNTSMSAEINVAVMATHLPNADVDYAHEQEQSSREQAAIRVQRRNLGAVARTYTAPVGYEVTEGFGQPMGLPERFPLPGVDANTKSAFTFDDEITAKRKKGKWKFWKMGR